MPKYREELFSYIAGVINGLGCATIIVGGMADHVHILFCMCASKGVSEIVRDVKANATRWMKQRLGCNFAWQQGYGVFSVSQTKLETVHNYIEQQAEHHRKKTFQEEYREFLANYKVHYDERFVWD